MQKSPSLSTRALNIVGGLATQRLELPAHAIFSNTGEYIDLSIRNLIFQSNEKGSSLSTRALNMAGVERFELPTRGFGIRCSANWSYTPVDLSNFRFEKTSLKARLSK